jgi:uncharacterized membrane protein YbhN (UPF0104 family)
MSHLSNKAKQYGLIALKVFILAATFWFIYSRLKDTDERTIHVFLQHLKNANPVYILLFILMAAANWTFEIMKWRELVRTLQSISFRETLRQCLTSLSAGLSTPNRIGEYGVKALFFPAEKRKKVMVLNLVSNSSQMLITIVFGIPGLIYFLNHYDISVAVWKPVALFVFVLLCIVAGYYFRKTQLLIKGLTLQNVVNYVKSLPYFRLSRVVGYSAIRYIIFGSLFYLILRFFSVEMDLFTAVPLITSMYLMASVLPSFFILDVAVKGGIAIWLFTFAGIEEIPVLCTVTGMWFLNFVLPAIWGSFYVAKFKIGAS